MTPSLVSGTVLHVKPLSELTCVVKHDFGLKSSLSFRMVSRDNSGQLPRDQQFSEQ